MPPGLPLTFSTSPSAEALDRIEFRCTVRRNDAGNNRHSGQQYRTCRKNGLISDVHAVNQAERRRSEAERSKQTERGSAGSQNARLLYDRPDKVHARTGLR